MSSSGDFESSVDFEKKCPPALARKAASIAFGMIEPENLVGGRHDLYAGRLGLALVHAVGSRLGLAGASREVALAGLEREVGRGAVEPPVGGLIGAGAVLYAQVVCAECLDEPEVLSAAGDVVERLGDEDFEADRHLDVLQGTAGTVLALLALERVARRHGRDDLADLSIEKAVAGARHLLRAKSPAEARAWSNAHGLVLTGFAHGAAGIACALLRLASRVGSGSDLGDGAGAWLAAAESAAEFEEELYDAEGDRWRLHARDTGDAGPHHAWCYGSPGIVLARLEAWRVGDAAGSAEGRLARAVRAALAAPLGESDHLCCGNLGRAWILAETSRRLRAAGATRSVLSSRLAAEAAVRSDRLAFDALRYFKRRESFGVNARESASLFKGLAGVCLAFLALSAPEEVPFVLDLSAPVDR